MEETMNMSRRQIKNWLAYREGIEQGINDTNRIELKKVANSLRNRLFDIIKNIHPWPTALTKDAMRWVYLIIAGYTRDRWVYIRRDYRLENEQDPEPGDGGRLVKNADVKIVKCSCQNPCKHTLNYYNTGNCFLNKDPRTAETVEPFSTDEDESVKAGPSSTSTPKETPHAGQGLGGPKQQ